MDILAVQNLCKQYEKFALQNVSFKLEPGYIMGFIGKNGAGKTTTLKSMLNLVRPDAGIVTMLGREFRRNELELKQHIGFMLGGVTFYPKQRLKNVTGVVRRFYTQWNDEVYRNYLRRFDLDQDKRVEALSSGMRVKYALTLALSHQPHLLLLDEPTSGLDPVSRDDILELFQEFIEDGERSILFSTQITSDLEKCADFVTYIKNGKIVASREKDDFLNSYRIVQGTGGQLTDDLRRVLIGYKKNAFGFTGLVRAEDLERVGGLEVSPPDIESIMIYHEKEQKL
jgi:ABC-2 type transport system ATP-binding protein